MNVNLIMPLFFVISGVIYTVYGAVEFTKKDKENIRAEMVKQATDDYLKEGNHYPELGELEYREYTSGTAGVNTSVMHSVRADLYGANKQQEITITLEQYEKALASDWEIISYFPNGTIYWKNRITEEYYYTGSLLPPNAKR